MEENDEGTAADAGFTMSCTQATRPRQQIRFLWLEITFQTFYGKNRDVLLEDNIFLHPGYF
jgi:hypothetical protein